MRYKKRKNKYSGKLAIGLLIVVMLITISAYTNMNNYIAAQCDEIVELSKQRDELCMQNKRIIRQINFSKTDEFIERTARNELGLIMPGQIRFVSAAGSN